MSIVRPGVYASWMQAWKKQLELNSGSKQNNDFHNLEELEHYACHGVTLQKPRYSNVSAAPSSKAWERFLPNCLKMHSGYRAMELEEEGILKSRWSNDLAGGAFAAAYTSEMVSILIHSLFPRRFGGRMLQMMDMKMLPYTALGLITGATNEALNLARLQIHAHQKGCYFAGASYPIFTFILRVFAGILQEPFVVVGEAKSEPIFNILFDNWREPNSAALIDPCLAACDAHTHRCAPSSKAQFNEFDNGSWMRTPIEILFLFKMRRMLGLENPVLDHPLMATVLGELPPEAGFHPDDLVARVRARMREDGYDEVQIMDRGQDSGAVP